MADSFDSGIAWTQAHPLDVTNPNSGLDAIALRDGRLVMIYNRSDSARYPLNLAIGEDAEHFRMFRVPEEHPAEYSHAGIIQCTGSDLHLTYTWNRERIEYVRLPLNEI